MKPIYIISKNLLVLSDTIAAVNKRASLVHSLINAFGLTEKLNVVSSVKASEEDVRSFHSEDYVRFLQGYSLLVCTHTCEEEDNFGLGFDCPPLQDTWNTVRELAGASLQAADALNRNEASLAINWYGGWHHAQRDTAAGFCYVNDVVLAIQRLRRRFDKVLYIDLDVHHGDGVENAFSFTPKVLTLSLHLHEPGFFPGTGNWNCVGMGRGRFFSVNVPYRAAVTDDQINFLLKGSLHEISKVFQPNALVCQCGADTLAGDPLGGANVSLKGYLNLVRQVLAMKLPTLLLGGGGYNRVNAAKLWAGLTFMAVNESPPEEIPEHSFFPLYGPDFTLDVSPTLKKSENSEEHMEQLLKKVRDNLRNLTPQVQMETT